MLCVRFRHVQVGVFLCGCVCVRFVFRSVFRGCQDESRSAGFEFGSLCFVFPQDRLLVRSSVPFGSVRFVQLKTSKLRVKTVKISLCAVSVLVVSCFFQRRVFVCSSISSARAAQDIQVSSSARSVSSPVKISLCPVSCSVLVVTCFFQRRVFVCSSISSARAGQGFQVGRQLRVKTSLDQLVSGVVFGSRCLVLPPASWLRVVGLVSCARRCHDQSRPASTLGQVRIDSSSRIVKIGIESPPSHIHLCDG